jgi:hypothetical protein
MGNSFGVAPTFDGTTGVSSTSAPTLRRRVELSSKAAHGMPDENRWRIEAACNLVDIVDDVGDRHVHERVIVDRCRAAATTPVESVNLVAGGRVDSGMFLPAPRCVATTVHADQRRPLRRIFRRSGESFDANAPDSMEVEYFSRRMGSATNCLTG